MDSIYLLEIIDINCLNALINSNCLSEKYDTSNYSQKMASLLYSNEKQQLISYLDKYDTKINAIKVQYKKPKHKYGRVFPCKSLGLTCLSKKIRNTLIKDRYIDIDLTNAQPKIIYNICKSNNIKCPYNEIYNFKREEILEEVINAYKVSRNDAKNLFIRMAFFGTFYGWLEELGLDTSLQPTLFIKGFKDELNVIANKIREHNPSLYESCRKQKEDKNEKNIIGSMFSLYLQDYEEQIMACSINWIINNTKIMDCNKSNYKIGTYEYDGIKLLKDRVDSYGGIQLLINNLQNVILTETGFEMMFEVKPIEKFFNIVYEPYVVPLTKTELKELKFNEKQNKLELEKENKLRVEELKTEEFINNNSDEDKLHILPNGKKINFDMSIFEGVHSDLECAQKLFKLYPYWVTYLDDLYVFDFETGIWVNNKTAYLKIMSKYQLYLHIMVYNSEEKKWITSELKSYGNCTSLMEKVIPLLKTLNINNDWLKQKQYSSLGKLLFENGYFDFKEKKFYDKNSFGFNPDILFMGKIHHSFTNFDDDEMNYMNDVKQRFFSNVLGEEVGNYFIHNLSKGLAGDMMKRLMFCLGETDCGKSTLTTALKLSCGDYFGSFNAENLAYRNTSNDEAQLMRWALLLRFKRIIISNEMKSTLELNGNMIKKISSGGDELIGRLHCKEEEPFITHFLPICFSNDMNKIKPYDNAVDNRVRVISYKKQFVDGEPQNEDEISKDYNIENEMKTLKFQRVFIGLLIRQYINYAEMETKPVEPDEVKQAKVEWIEPENNIIQSLLNDFELTNNVDDYVKSKDFEDWLKDNNKGISIRRLAVDLKKYASKHKLNNISNKDKKIGGKSLKCWFGIKKLIDDIEEQ